mmetsp:Transcript_16094/g.13613  ORF Transcript_16094/g.13613 Transcript_16094/m.13613 type:complete len:228 (-) Transcript_16094:2808-3491(-)
MSTSISSSPTRSKSCSFPTLNTSKTTSSQQNQNMEIWLTPRSSPRVPLNPAKVNQKRAKKRKTPTKKTRKSQLMPKQRKNYNNSPTKSKKKWQNLVKVMQKSLMALTRLMMILITLMKRKRKKMEKEKGVIVRKVARMKATVMIRCLDWLILLSNVMLDGARITLIARELHICWSIASIRDQRSSLNARNCVILSTIMVDMIMLSQLSRAHAHTLTLTTNILKKLCI